MSNSSVSSEASSLFAKKGQASPAVVPRQEAESAYQYLLDMPIVADDRDTEVPQEQGRVVVEVRSGDSAVRLAEPNTQLSGMSPDSASLSGEQTSGESADSVGSLLALDFRRWRLEEPPQADAAEAVTYQTDSESRGRPELRLFTRPEQGETQAPEPIETSESAQVTGQAFGAGDVVGSPHDIPEAVEPLIPFGAPESGRHEYAEPSAEVSEGHATEPEEIEGAAAAESVRPEVDVAGPEASEVEPAVVDSPPLIPESAQETLSAVESVESAIADSASEDRTAVVEGAPALQAENTGLMRPAFEPSGSSVGSAIEASPRKKWLLPLAASVCLAVAGIYFFGGDDQQVVQDPNTTEDATSAATPSSEAQRSESQVGQDQKDAPAASDGMKAGAVDSAKVGTEDAASQNRAAQDQASSASGAAEQVQNEVASQAVEVEQPTVDLVRIETDGSAIIAGTAAPGSELIVMDNGEPIGAVVADAVGSWMLMPDLPLPQGDHRISLVLNTPQGSVEIHHDPQAGNAEPDAAATPVEDGAVKDGSTSEPGQNGAATGVGTGEQSSIPNALDEEARAGPAAEKTTPGTDDRDEVAALGPPLPVRNPTRTDAEAVLEEGTVIEGNFVVQLSSAKTSVGAAQEWLKLRQRYPEILGSREVEFNRSPQGSNSTYYRIRTGGFEQKEAAQNLCNQLKKLEQDCLVIQR